MASSALISAIIEVLFPVVTIMLPDAWLAAYPYVAGAGRSRWSIRFCDIDVQFF